MKAIEDSKSRDLNRLIYALGIRHVGEHSAWVLANHFGSIDKLSSAGIDKLTRIDEIGPVVAESINDFFNNKENLKVLKRLSEADLNMSQPKIKGHIGSLEGKRVVITGTFKNYSRSEAEEIVRRLGGNPSSSVSKSTYFLAAGEEPGSAKIDKAKASGVKIIYEEEFRRIVGS